LPFTYQKRTAPQVLERLKQMAPTRVSKPQLCQSGHDLVGRLPPEVQEAIRQEIEREVALQLHERAAAHHRLLELAQEGGRVGVFEIDMRSGLSTGSSMWARLLALPEGAATVDRQAWAGMLHPEDREHVLGAVAKAVMLGCDTALDYRITLPDGTIRWLHSRNLIEKDEHGRSFRAYGTLQDITDRKRLEAEIQHSANHDSLTGLPNRRRFMEELCQAFEDGHRNSEQVAVALFDLDNLKPTNDLYGHEAGDVLIQASAGRLGSVAVKAGLAARLGGDEFALLLRGRDARQLRRLAERSLQAIRRPVSFGNITLQSSASAGGAVDNIASDSSPEALLRKADLALYVAKRNARGTYHGASRS
jgi:diguanylate cyclase (GGDEF)-like protein